MGGTAQGSATCDGVQFPFGHRSPISCFTGPKYQPIALRWEPQCLQIPHLTSG